MFLLINKCMEHFKSFMFGKNAMRSALAIIWSLFAMCYISAITFVNLPESGIRFADVSQGFVMGTIVGGVMAFYFGTSQGSVDKNEIIKNKISDNEVAE